MKQQFPAVVSSGLPVSDEKGYSNLGCLWDDIYFLYTNFHGQDRMIGHIKMPIEQLAASMIELKSISVHSTP